MDQEAAPKHFPNQTCTTKSHGHFWWPAAGLIHYSFLNPGENITFEKYTQQLDEMHRKLQCLQLTLLNRKDSILLHDNTQLRSAQPTFQNLSKLGYKVLSHPPPLHLTSHQLNTTFSSTLTVFFRENDSTTNRMQKTLSKSWSNPKTWIFMLHGINFSLGKKKVC